MSTINNVIENMITNALMQTHTAFCGKVISVNADKTSAKVQPLNMIKAIKGNAQKQAVIPDVPILQPTYKAVGVEYELNIEAGDTVFCVCAERDITETKKGNFATPVRGRHMLSDAVIVGKFEV